MKNYYKILEVEPDATLEQIKEQYRLFLHAWHPDKFNTTDQKVKAGDRLKEINEAYSIIGDPNKRKVYDQEFSSFISPSSSSTYMHVAQEHGSTIRKNYCQSCGLPNETKYIEFYQNVGMLLMRHHSSIKGNFCKSCVEFYFWNMTGKTMLLGWWGVISLIVTPFILLNNIIRFISITGMKKPLIKITPNPSPFWIFSTIGGCIVIGLLIFSALIGQSSMFQNSRSPLNTSVPMYIIPTYTPVVIIAPTVTKPYCINWTKITSSIVGQKVCVYGKVYDISSTSQISTMIKFSPEFYMFFLEDVDHTYPDLREGDCVVAEEVVKLSGYIPYMSVNNLYKCESWMK